MQSGPAQKLKRKPVVFDLLTFLEHPGGREVPMPTCASGYTPSIWQLFDSKSGHQNTLKYQLHQPVSDLAAAIVTNLVAPTVQVGYWVLNDSRLKLPQNDVPRKNPKSQAVLAARFMFLGLINGASRLLGWSKSISTELRPSEVTVMFHPFFVILLLLRCKMMDTDGYLWLFYTIKSSKCFQYQVHCFSGFWSARA